jgi:two-component system nitrate/nitrite sensor histidine kinase NarX
MHHHNPPAARPAAAGEHEHKPYRFVGSYLRRNRLALPILSIIAVLTLLFITILRDPSADVSSGHAFIQLSLVLLGGLSVVFLLLRLRKQMIQPLSDLRAWSKRIRAGDLVTPIPKRGRGEFAELIDDINSLSEELQVLTEEMDYRVRAQTEHIADKSRSLEILYDVATSLSTAHNLDVLLEQFLDTLMTLVDARAASVRIMTNEHETQLVASRGLSDSVVSQERNVDINRCLCGNIARFGGLGIQKGVEQCNRFLDCPIVDGEVNELIVVPLQYQDRILGVYNLFLDRPSSDLGKDARDMLNSIGKHLGLALAKARLDENERRLAVMEERNMLGNELHDSLAQSLVSMRLQIKMLGEILHKRDLRAAQYEVSDLNHSIEEAHASLRELLSNFRFRLDEGGLLPSIDNLVRQFRTDSGITTYFQNECNDTILNMTPVQEVQLFRIIQESLSNVRRHSDASNVRILLSCNGETVTLLVEDDGSGMVNIQAPDKPGEHIGLSIMRERADRLNGTLSFESEPGEGTSVRLVFEITPA